MISIFPKAGGVAHSRFFRMLDPCTRQRAQHFVKGTKCGAPTRLDGVKKNDSRSREELSLAAFGLLSLVKSPARHLPGHTPFQ